MRIIINQYFLVAICYIIEQYFSVVEHTLKKSDTEATSNPTNGIQQLPPNQQLLRMGDLSSGEESDVEDADDKISLSDDDVQCDQANAINIVVSTEHSFRNLKNQNCNTI